MTMRPENEREVYELADEARALMKGIDREVHPDSLTQDDVETVKKNLELIRRRADPARHD